MSNLVAHHYKTLFSWTNLHKGRRSYGISWADPLQIWLKPRRRSATCWEFHPAAGPWMSLDVPGCPWMSLNTRHGSGLHLSQISYSHWAAKVLEASRSEILGTDMQKHKALGEQNHSCVSMWINLQFPNSNIARTISSSPKEEHQFTTKKCWYIF